jgi:chitin disaccharide deacetylase
MNRRIWVVADDYGLAPGVNEGILALIEANRISGTSCMTVFPDWKNDAVRLKPHVGRAALGLHLTLTDQPALTGISSLAPTGRLPSFAKLAAHSSLGTIDQRHVHAELDAQLSRFVEAFAEEPNFVDGHQHVHFLPVVRDWLRVTFASRSGKPRPKLRGSPSMPATADMVAAKVATISALALGFDSAMRKSGFEIMGPLLGIYDWRNPAGFEAALERAVAGSPDGGLFMCHPGKIDAVLQERDPMLAARPVELQTLLSDHYLELLSQGRVSLAGIAA